MHVCACTQVCLYASVHAPMGRHNEQCRGNSNLIHVCVKKNVTHGYASCGKWVVANLFIQIPKFHSHRHKHTDVNILLTVQQNCLLLSVQITGHTSGLPVDKTRTKELFPTLGAPTKHNVGILRLKTGMALRVC